MTTVYAWIFLATLPIYSIHGQTVADVLSNTPSLQDFRKLFTSEQLEFLQTNGQGEGLTLFAINNTIYQRFITEGILSESDFRQPDNIEYHVALKTIRSADFNLVNSMTSTAKTMSSNRIVFLSKNDGNSFVNDVLVNPSQSFTYNAENGIVYTMDKPLFPIASTKLAINAAKSLVGETQTMYEILTKARKPAADLSVFFDVQFNKGNQPKTIFLTSDSFFADILDEDEKKLFADTEKLYEVAAAHILLGDAVFTSTANLQRPYYSYGGTQVRFILADEVQVDGTTVQVLYVQSMNVQAKIIKANIVFNDGVVHLIDRLLGFVHDTAWTQLDVWFREKRIKWMYEYYENKDALNQILKSTNYQLTLLLPVDSAFTSIPAAIRQNLFGNPLNFESQLDILKNHMILGSALPLASFSTHRYNSPYKIGSYAGQELRFFKMGNAIFVQGNRTVGQFVANYSDTGVTNGVIHGIDQVLGAPSFTMWEQFARFTLIGSGSYYFRRANLDGLLDSQFSGSSGRLYTALIPEVNSWTTYADQGSERWNGFDILNSYEHRSILRKLLERHLVHGAVYLSDLRVGEQMQLSTVSGDQLTLTKRSDSEALISFKGASVRVILADIGCSNGVVFVINNVISEGPALDYFISSAVSIFHGLRWLYFFLAAFFLFVHYFLTL